MIKTNLPQPSVEEIRISQSLSDDIALDIAKHHGFLPFSSYMRTILYDPTRGYYSGRLNQIGAQGDFVTAPQLSDLFGQSIARQWAQILPQTAGFILELGAGAGTLAADIVSSLPENLLKKYYILELSPTLRARQRAWFEETIPQQAHRIEHLETLPESFDGIIFGNEVLDAVPCEWIKWQNDGIYQIGITLKNNQLSLDSRILPTALAQKIESLDINAPYQSEVNIQSSALVSTLAQKLVRGALFWIDYGFGARDYYHPQRTMGTLIGHYRHRTLHDPLWMPGLVDWTAHVDFTAVADAATAKDLDFLGFTTQSAFLLDCGIIDLLSQKGNPNETAYIRAAEACQKLLAPQEMGEIFKVIAFGKAINPDLIGFQRVDLSAQL